MGSRYFQRPENAISKAEEFMKVGKPSRALDTLYDVIKSKKRNHQYSEKLIEEIMFKYLELCVDLKKSHIAKEGLFQYRNMCQSVNVASLASVVQGYLNMAEKRTEAARQESQDKVEVDDLDNIATPEMIMLSAVSGEGAQDRSDRTILMPWVKFLWESYCQCLELLRTNSRVERLYHDIAQQAFKFCLKYQRKTEFRKLCDKLRNHLDLIIKQQTPSSAPSINLNNAETQQMNLDTRLVQLDAAIHMELWQEAYKAVEDIHGLMSLSKKVFQPKMMANYYQKLALVFWKSDQYLFHAAAVFKHFQLTREMKRNISSDELAKMASRVLAAVLCVPLPSQHPEFDRFIETDRSPAEKMARLAVLLSLNQPPTRQSLLRDCQRFNVVSAASPQLQDLYNWLEVEFHPLTLCGKVDTKLKEIEETEELSALHQYVGALRDMTLVRLLKQVAQVYQSIQLSRLLELAKYASSHHIERLIVESARQNDMQVRIDHRTKSVHFGTDLTESQRTDLPEGPHLQAMPSEQVRTQLMRMLEVLDNCTKIIHPDQVKLENKELRQRIVEAYHQSKVRDHQRLLARHKIIEERKEWLEKLNTAQQQEQARDAARQQKQAQEQELERLRLESLEREKNKQMAEVKATKEKILKDKVAQLDNTEIGKKVLAKMNKDELENLDADEIMARQVEELEKEKKELQIRLKSQEKKVDHLERAKRLEEIPLLKEEFVKFKDDAREVWIEQEKERIEGEKKERDLAVLSSERLGRMKEDKDKYLENLLNERKQAFDRKLKEFTKLREDEREKRMEIRKEERKEERRKAWVKQKEEEEQRRLDEQRLAEKETREREEAEKRRKEEEEYAAEKAKLDAIAKRQKEREEEVERKLREEKKKEQERERPAEPRRPVDEGPWRKEPRREEEPRRREEEPRRREDGPGGAWRPGGGGWRDKEREKVDVWGPGGERRRDGPRRDDDGGGWRKREEKQGEERDGPRRDDDRRLSPRRDDGPPRRDFGTPGRRGFGDRDGPPRRDFGRDDDGPKRDEDRPPRRDFGRDDDRGPRRDDDRPPRRDDDRPPRRDDDGPGDWRRDRGPPREEREPPRGPRGGFGRDDERGPRRDFGRDDDRGPRRDFPDRGPPRRDFEDRGPPRRDVGRDDDRPPRRDDSGERGGGGNWRAGPRKDDPRTPSRRDEGRRMPSPTGPRTPSRREEPRPGPGPRDEPQRTPPKTAEDGGWTTVSKR